MPVTIILNGKCGQLTPKQSSLINSVPGVPAVSIPLITLFAALSLHEPERGLPAPAESQFAACLVSCFRSLESANTDDTFVVNIPVTNTVVKRINTISD